MTVATCSSVLDPATSRVVVLYDTRDPAGNGALLDTQWAAPQMHNEVPLSVNTWNRDNLGNVFGLCMDDANDPNIYVTATRIFGFGIWGAGGPGGVYQLNGTTGAISTFATLPNTGMALGNIDHETIGGHFYVSNFDDGMIYPISAGGVVGTPYDHGVDGIPGTANDIPDDPTLDLTQLGRRVWGLQVNEVEDRLYYAVWWEASQDIAGVDNEIWSVALSPTTREPIVGTAVLEFTIGAKPLSWGGTAVNPVADITFDDTGTRMVLSQRSMQANGLGNGAHQSYVLEYNGSSGAWIASADNKFLVGNYGNGANAAGGVDLDCEGNVWASGDALHLGGSPTEYLYGMQRIPAAGGSTVPPFAQTSYLVDFDCNIFDFGDKTQLGDVEHRRAACATCSVMDEEILCDEVQGDFTYTFSIANDSGVDADRIRLFPTGNFTMTPDTIFQTIVDGTSGTVTVQISGATPGTTICFEVWLMADQFTQCCVVEHCIDLPTCCLEFETINLACDPDNPGCYLLDFNVTNLSTIAADRVFLWPTPQPNPGYSFSVDEFASPADFAGPIGLNGNTGPLSTKIIGGASGSTICFEVSIHDSETGDCCFETICVTLPECDGCDVPDECHVPPLTACQPEQPGSDVHIAIVDVEICNFCSDVPTEFTWSVNGITGAGCPTAYLTPASFTPDSGVTPVLPPGECFSFPIVIDCTNIMPGDTACFEVMFTNAATGLTTSCVGQVRRAGNIGGGGVDPTGGIIDVPFGESVLVSFDLSHLGAIAPPTEMVLSESTSTITNNPGLSLDGLPPGTPVTGVLDLPAGTSTTVVTQVSIPTHDPLAVHSLFLLVDSDGDGNPDPILSASLRSVRDGDCNGNMIPDDVEIAIGAEVDADGDGVPDSCQLTGNPNFIRGDANNDLGFDIGDPVFLLAFIFTGGDAPPCLTAGDVNADGAIDIADPVSALGVLFNNGTPPSSPHPNCGASLAPLGCSNSACP